MAGCIIGAADRYHLARGILYTRGTVWLPVIAGGKRPAPVPQRHDGSMNL